MSKQISNTDSLSFIPVTYESSTFTESSNTSNGLTDSNSSTYAQFKISTTNAYAIYSFDITDIPSNATINSVECNVKASVTSTNNITRTLQLYSGTIAKSSAVTITGTTATSHKLTTETWTTSELSNCKIQISAYCTNTSLSRSVYVYFYGATLTVSYTYQSTIYEITIENNTSNVTTNVNSLDIEEGGSGTIYMYGYTNETVTDNNTDVTQYVIETSESTSTYTLDNIQEDHIIVIGTDLYTKISGVWERIISINKKVNGEWVTITKTEASEYISSLTNVLYYAGHLSSISLSWTTIIIGETLQFTTKIDNVATTTGVTYSITTGSEYAVIDSTGLLSINSNANKSYITVTSSYENLTVSKNLIITYMQSSSSESTNTYVITNEDGSETTRIETIEENEDGTTIITTQDTTTNQDGSSSEITTTITDNGDGSSQSTTSTTNYDENGDISGSSENNTITNSDGSSQSITTNYDSNGNETGHETSNTDTSGNTSTQTIEKDENGDDIVTNYDIDTNKNQDGGLELNGNNGIDTGIIAFDGNDFEIYLKARISAANNTSASQAPILNIRKDENGGLYGITLTCTYISSAQIMSNSSSAGLRMNAVTYNGSTSDSKWMRMTEKIGNYYYYFGIRTSDGYITYIYRIVKSGNLITVRVYDETDENLIGVPRSSSSSEEYTFTFATELDDVTIEVGHSTSRQGLDQYLPLEILEFHANKIR